MGTWGSGIFEDDLAADIRGSFEDALGEGQPREVAAQQALQQFAKCRADEDEEAVLYLSLASLLLDAGVVEHPALHRAIAIIKSGLGLERWREAGEDALRDRKEIYRQLRARIEAKSVPEATPKRRTKLPKVGDYFEIPLSDGRYAYGQYVFHDETQGPLLQILDAISDRQLAISDLVGARPLFRPIITYLNDSVRTGRWRVVGSGTVDRFTHPGFIGGNADQSGRIREWWFWDGRKDNRLGPRLPGNLRDCEFLLLWPLDDVEERIRTGHDPYIDRLRAANNLG